MSEFIKVERDGAVLVVTLARPEKKNALTGAMYEALIAAFAEASDDASVAALLIEGSGGVFSAGNDIGDFLAYALAPGAQIGEAPVMRFIYALARFGKPLVAAVEGPAVGLGTTLCFHCDLVYASPSARFHMPFVDLGLVPEAGSSLLAPLRFGRARASQYLLLGEPFDAETARADGLINAIVDAAALHAHALAKAKALAAKPRQALLTARRLIRGDEATVIARMDEEVKLFQAALKSPEAQAAFMAFMKRSKN
jgi:enoyl-CoA hydratase/carnithine racemase